jgi:DNA-binding beta-propeller fold protein YncE
VDNTGNVYVADTYNNRIQKFDSSGDYMAKWGGPFGLGIRGEWRGWFTVPSGVAVDGKGRIIIADSANNRVVILSSDGRYLAEWKSNISTNLFSPTRVAVGKGGVIYVVDTAENRIVTLKYNDTSR